MKIRVLRDLEPPRSEPPPEPSQPIEISFRRSVRVAQPIAIKEARRERRGFKRAELIADQKRTRKY